MDAAQHPLADPPHARRIFCNRTLNLRQVRAIGYDMDYTLIHYRTEVWEEHAYEIARAKLQVLGWPVEHLRFDPELMIRGLIIDVQLGHVLKVNSFGYVKHAYHGTKPMDLETQRRTYARLVISLSDPRFIFMNTLFSLSEACLYAQMVDLLDAQALPSGIGYQDLYRKVRGGIDDAHVEGQLKAEIVANPERFVDLDPDMPMALLDQHHAGKKLLLITNSDWAYTRPIMDYVFAGALPGKMVWRDLFDIIIVDARKPAFFSARAPLFEVVSDDGLLRPVSGRRAGAMQQGHIYQGGDAGTVEASLGMNGDEILYVGDHLFGDVNVSKQLLRWRTALVLRELELDVAAIDAFAAKQQQLGQLMQKKERLEQTMSQLKIRQQRQRLGYGHETEVDASLTRELGRTRQAMLRLDNAIRPMAEAASRLANDAWGPVMRAGNDKSHLARQVERYADIYMSRVSNFLHITPFGYLRSMRGSLPHDPTIGPSVEGAPR
jgi:5'-nucleotidase